MDFQNETNTELKSSFKKKLQQALTITWHYLSGIQSHYTFKELPFLIFGGLSLVAAGVSFLLPETRGINLPDTVEEVEGIQSFDLELKDQDVTKTISKQSLVKTEVA